MIDIRAPHDGGQRAQDVAGWIAEFVAKARRSLDLAHYDFRRSLLDLTAQPL
jgi:hypothetical protein